MPSAQTLDILRPHELSEADAALWRDFVAGNPALSGPYFDIDYVRAIGAHVPRSYVARFSEAGRVVGFFAYQIRAGVMQPLGAPLSDYHGVVALPGVLVDIEALLKKVRAGRLEFQGWAGALPASARVTELKRRHAEVRHGFEVWWDERKAADNKYMKNVARCQRNVEKDFGGFDFSWEPVTPEVMDWIIGLKRAQYKRSGMHDVFACGWTLDMLNGLAGANREGFGLRAGVYRHDDRIVAAEIALLGGNEVHLWFPAYDADYYRYSVGILLTIDIIRHLSGQGVHIFDYGTGGEDYKSPTTTLGATVCEGEVRCAFDPVRELIDTVLARVLARAPTGRERIMSARTSLSRRTHIIRATEVSLAGWSRAMLSLAHRAVGRLKVS